MTESWWSDVDDAILDLLAAAGGRLSLADLASALDMSEDAVRSAVAMLAERNSVRIVAVELSRPRALPPRVGAGAAALSRRVSSAPHAAVRRRGRAARASDPLRAVDPRRAESPPPESRDDVDPAVDV